MATLSSAAEAHHSLLRPRETYHELHGVGGYWHLAMRGETRRNMIVQRISFGVVQM